MLRENLLRLLAISILLSTSPCLADNAEALRLYNLGVGAYNKHDIATATKNFQAALALDPTLAEAHCNYGNTLIFAGKYEDALAELTKARDMKPDLVAVWSGLGACYQSLGMTPEAVTAYKKYLSMSPNSDQAGKVKSLIGMLEQNEAARTTSSTIKNGPDDYIGDATRNGIIRWPVSRMPIKTYIKSGTGVVGYRPEYETMFRQSMQEWLDSSNGKITIQYVDNPSDAQMVVSWTNNPKEMISSVEGGHAMVSPDSQGILKTHITLLTIQPEDSSAVTANQAHRIDLHEIGHAFGLFGHSSSPSDIMFGSMTLGDQACALSEKDKNTIVALYSFDADTVARNPLNNTGNMIAGDASSNVVRAAKLNHDAVEALHNKNFVLGAQKLEQARKLDPSNDLYSENLGGAYTNCAAMMMMTGNMAQANEYFAKAIPLLEKSNNKTNLIAVLQNYLVFCRGTNKPAEAQKTEARLKQLGAL